MKTYRWYLLLAAMLVAMANLASVAWAQAKPRARDLGVPFEGTPGPLDALTDVKGVEVGHTTLISGSGKLVVGQGPVRTGVTAILPQGKSPNSQVFAGWYSLNGNGEMTGTTWVEESGFLEGPVMITNTHSVGVVRDAVIKCVKMVSNDNISPIFSATLEATEEAIVNALVAAQTMDGADGHTAIALPHDRLRELLKKYNRLTK